MNDGYKFIARRKQLVASLTTKGIRSALVLKAIGDVPREKFMNQTLVELAYEDKAYPINAGQTISQPFTVAKQTELLDLSGGEKVLEIGTGSGYQAAVLCQCRCSVYSIERQKELYVETSRLLSSLGYKVNCSFGDGFAGWKEQAPFDRVLITAGCPEIPQELIKQLSIGGLLVMPFGNGAQLKMLRIKRLSETEFRKEEFGDCSFVPMLKGVVE
ncbi:MAG: protein-L-isoaspartate(D-aspartate) O-methyltransferase [Paludibacteraceae bacterium]|nr:protein-L-isoaspartate(D-aspartate) O-methyltransferase [Paludibacteraceae bacterium]